MQVLVPIPYPQQPVVWTTVAYDVYRKFSPAIDAGRATCNLDDCRTRRLRSNTNWGGWAAQASTHDIDRATSIVVTSSKVEPLEYVEAPLAGVQLALRIYFRIHAS